MYIVGAPPHSLFCTRHLVSAAPLRICSAPACASVPTVRHPRVLLLFPHLSAPRVLPPPLFGTPYASALSPVGTPRAPASIVRHPVCFCSSTRRHPMCSCPPSRTSPSEPFGPVPQRPLIPPCPRLSSRPRRTPPLDPPSPTPSVPRHASSRNLSGIFPSDLTSRSYNYAVRCYVQLWLNLVTHSSIGC